MMTPEQIATRYCILRSTVGSELYGTAVGGGDRDEMGVCIEPPGYVIGLDKFEHWVHRTQPEGVKSGPDDLDLTIYSLRKWVRLAAGGNPTMMLLGFAPADMCSVRTPEGVSLQDDLMPHIVSRSCANSFLGYLTQQRQRLTGERGGRRKPARQDLVDAHGFDTKYAGHVVRLGFQGRDLLTDGRVDLPMPPHQREYIKAVRRGEVDLSTILKLAEDLENEIKRLRDSGPLADRPDSVYINGWLVRTYRNFWSDNSFKLQ